MSVVGTALERRSEPTTPGLERPAGPPGPAGAALGLLRALTIPGKD